MIIGNKRILLTAVNTAEFVSDTIIEPKKNRTAVFSPKWTTVESFLTILPAEG